MEEEQQEGGAEAVARRCLAPDHSPRMAKERGGGARPGVRCALIGYLEGAWVQISMGFGWAAHGLDGAFRLNLEGV